MVKGRNPLFAGYSDYLIVNVGKILYIANLVAPIFKVSAQYVENAELSRVADVDKIVNGGAAGVDVDLIAVYRL